MNELANLYDIYADARVTTAHTAGLQSRFRIATAVDWKRREMALKDNAKRNPRAVETGKPDPLADGGVYVAAEPIAAFVDDGAVFGFVPVVRS